MSNIGDGLDSPAIEQDPSIAQLQSQQASAAFVATFLPDTGFVASINGLTGLLTFADGANISITDDGVGNITFSVVGLGGAATAKTNIAAGAPSPSNDESESYNYFSLWIDTTVPNVYMCLNPATGAAVWVLLN